MAGLFFFFNLISIKSILQIQSLRDAPFDSIFKNILSCLYPNFKTNEVFISKLLVKVAF